MNARRFYIEFEYRRKHVFRWLHRLGRTPVAVHVSSYWLHPTKGWRKYG